MKHARYAAFALLTVLLLFASCSGNPFAGPDGKAVTDGGKVSITIPAVSAGISKMVTKYQMTKGFVAEAAGSGSRAFAAASRVLIYFYSAVDGSFVTSAEYYPNTAFSSPGEALTVGTVSLAAGDYTANVYVYNNNNDYYSPTVYASGVAFSVTAGGNTPVVATCLPNSFSSLNGYNSEAGALGFQPYYAWTMYSGGGVQYFGTESWFQFQATSSTLYTKITAKPDSASSPASTALPFMLLFDANGNFIAEASPGADGSTSLVATTSIDSTYYIGVADFGSGESRWAKLWFEDYTPPVVSNTTLPRIGKWNDFVLNSGELNTHTFQAEAGVIYKIGWNDSYSYGGDGTKTKDLAVDILKADATTYYLDSSNGTILSWVDSSFDIDDVWEDTVKANAVQVLPTADELVTLLVHEYSTGSSAGTYAVRIAPQGVHNTSFTLAGYNDADIVYTTDAAMYASLNVMDGDYLPGWEFRTDAYMAEQYGGFRVDLGAGSVRMVGGSTAAQSGYTNVGGNNNTYAGSSVVWDSWVAQDGIQYTTTANTAVDIDFKINSYYGGHFYSYEGYQAPVKVWLKFNETWYLFNAFTTLYNERNYDNTATDYSYLDTGIDHVFSMRLANFSTVFENMIIPVGTRIQGIQIECQGQYWDVTLNSIKLAEHP